MLSKGMILQLENHRDAKESLRELIEKELHILGNPSYAYFVLNKTHHTDNLIISNYPKAWIETYRENSYHHIDPVVLTALKQSSPFYWGRHINSSFANQPVDIFTYSEEHNIITGQTFVLHDHVNNLAMLTLLIDEDEKKTWDKNIAKQQALQLSLININEKMYSLEKKLISKKKQSSSKEILSTRECETLYWSCMGKTYAEIGIIMGISLRTVKFHMANIKRKLNVSHSRQALCLGVELNIIKPPSIMIG